jgi:hypothetical protein
MARTTVGALEGVADAACTALVPLMAIGGPLAAGSNKPTVVSMRRLCCFTLPALTQAPG